MSMRVPEILLAVPLALQDGVDKYNGVMRFLTEWKLQWNIRLDRFTPSAIRPTIGEKDSFDGAIIDGCASPGMAKAYAKSRMPLVAIDWRHPDIGNSRRRFVRIDSDNAEIGRFAAKTLTGLGEFASFAFLPLSNDIIWSTQRGEAFARTLRRKKRTIITLDPTLPLGPQFQALPKPSAVFAANDEIGAKALNVCVHTGIAVPEDLSVLSVDNEQFTCSHTNPPLASIQPDFEKSGYMAAAALAAMLDRKAARTHQLYHVKGIAPRQSMEPSRSSGRLIQRALELIRDSHSTFANIDGLARQLGVSRRLLDLRFREIQSRSVLDAILEIRMNKVCELLKSTNLPISEICANSSLGTGTNPLRAFRKRFGMTMRTYREQHRH